jgi:ketosteroid isomerase-like protein
MRHQLSTFTAMFLIAVFCFALPTNAQERLASVALPQELDRVLRDYEKAWTAKDADALAALFTPDGFVLSNGKPPVRGRAAIRAAYAGAGGPLFLRALSYSTDGSVGFIIGGFAMKSDGPDGGKFTLALRKGESGAWLIEADMDNVNAWPRAAAPAPPPSQ